MTVVFILLEIASLILYRYAEFMGYELMTIAGKYLTSAIFFAFGAHNLYASKNQDKYHNLVNLKLLFALFISFLSDVIIEVNQLSGVVIFVIVQIILILAYLELAKISLKIILSSLILMGILFVMEYFIPFTLGRLAIPVYLFIVFASIATSLAVAGTAGKTSGRTLIAVAAVLYIIANYTYQFTIPVFGIVDETTAFAPKTIQRILYYSAQMLNAIALSRPIIGYRKERKVRHLPFGLDGDF